MSSTTSGPLQNIYYERKVATPRPCYICKKETSTVLATVKTEDFLYTCVGHLSDVGFATLISAPPTTPPGPTADDIKKVVTDYEARQAKKAEDAKNKDKQDKESEKGKSKDGDGKIEGKPTSTSPLPASIPIASPPQTHKKYALHRQIFDMRKQEIKRKEQAQKAKEFGKMIPRVPNSNF